VFPTTVFTVVVYGTQTNGDTRINLEALDSSDRDLIDVLVLSVVEDNSEFCVIICGGTGCVALLSGNVIEAFKEEMKDKPSFPVIIVWGGNKVKESNEIIKEMTKDLPIRLEIYGEDPVSGPHYNIYAVDLIAERVKKLVERYRKSKRSDN